MIIYAPCKYCKNELSFRSSTPSRMEYSKEYDDYKVIPCQCGHSNNFHVDELRARESNLNTMFAMLIGLSLILAIGYLVLFAIASYIIIGGFISIPFIAYGVLRKQEQNNVSNWNRIKINSGR